MNASNSRAVSQVPELFAAQRIAYDVARVAEVVAYDAEDVVVVVAVRRLMTPWHCRLWKTLCRTLPEVVRSAAAQRFEAVKRADGVTVLPVSGDVGSPLMPCPLLRALLVVEEWN